MKKIKIVLIILFCMILPLNVSANNDYLIPEDKNEILFYCNYVINLGSSSTNFVGFEFTAEVYDSTKYEHYDVIIRSRMKGDSSYILRGWRFDDNKNKINLYWCPMANGYAEGTCSTQSHLSQPSQYQNVYAVHNLGEASFLASDWETFVCPQLRVELSQETKDSEIVLIIEEGIYEEPTNCYAGSECDNPYSDGCTYGQYECHLQNAHLQSYGVPNPVVTEPDPGEAIYRCEVIPKEIRDWIEDTLNLVKYVALVLVMVLGVLDFIKAAASGEADQMKKSGESFLKRIIAVIILFLVPVIVDLLLNLIEIYGADSNCINY